MAEMSVYDRCAQILGLLWTNDDILFEEDYDTVLPRVKELHGLVHDKQTKFLLDILNRAKDSCLDQEDLFDAQGLAEDITKEYAEREHRWSDFCRSFPWL